MVPATAAIGPTPALRAAPVIRVMTGSSESGSYGSNVAAKKGSRAIYASSTCRAAIIPAFAARYMGGIVRKDRCERFPEMERLPDHSGRVSARCGQASMHLPQRMHFSSSSRSFHSASKREDLAGTDADAGAAVHALALIVAHAMVEDPHMGPERCHRIADKTALLVRDID